MLKTLLLISLLCLAACNATHEVRYFTPEPASDDMAVVYIYRPFVMSNAIYSPELFVNGEYKLSVKNGKSSRITLSPGEYMFEVEPDNNYSGLTRTSLTLTAGKTYFLRLDTSLKIISATTYQPYQRNYNLIMIDEKLATDQIQQCCLAKQSSSTKQGSPSEVEKHSIDGFSVDKTQNPFSH